MVTLAQIQMKIAESIKQCGVSQSAIAKALNITPQTVSCYVHGKKFPALDTFANLCAVLDLDPAEILCLTDYGKTASNVHNDFRHNNGTIVNTFKQK